MAEQDRGLSTNRAHRWPRGGRQPTIAREGTLRGAHPRRTPPHPICSLFGAALVGLVALSACRDEDPTTVPGSIVSDSCTEELDSGCWTLLGLEDQNVTGIAVTAWGIVAGTANGSIFRLGADRRWEETMRPDDKEFPRPLVFAPSDPPRLLAGAGFRWDMGSGGWSAALYVSFDGGQSWAPSDAGVRAGDYTLPAIKLAVDPANPLQVFLSTQFGEIYRSTDGGETWEESGQNVHPVRDILVDPHSEGGVWVSVSQQLGNFGPHRGAIVHSPDMGQTWDAAVHICNGEEVFQLGKLGVTSGIPRRLFIAGYSAYSGGNPLLIWTDATGVAGPWECVDAPDMFKAFVALAGKQYGAGHGGLFRMAESAAAWDAVATPASMGVPEVAVVDEAQGLMLFGTTAGVWALKPY